MSNNNSIRITEALDNNGKILDKRKLAIIISDICLILKNRIGRDLGRENYLPHMITEINQPVVTENNIQLVFRIGIVWCEIVAKLDKKKEILNNPTLGILY